MKSHSVNVVRNRLTEQNDGDRPDAPCALRVRGAHSGVREVDAAERGASERNSVSTSLLLGDIGSGMPLADVPMHWGLTEHGRTAEDWVT